MAACLQAGFSKPVLRPVMFGDQIDKAVIFNAFYFAQQPVRRQTQNRLSKNTTSRASRSAWTTVTVTEPS